MNEIDIKRENIAKWIKIGGLGAVLMVAAFIFSILLVVVGAFTTGLAVIVLSAVISAAMAIAAVNFLPVWAMKCANMATKAKINEAQNNPIETLINEISEMEKEREAYKKLSVDMEAKTTAIEEEVEVLRKTDPEGAAMYDEDIRLNKLELQERDEQLKEFTKNQVLMQELLKRMQGRWKIAQMHKDYEKMRPKGKDQYMRKVLVDAASTAVMEAAARSRANLRVNAVEAEARRALLAEKNARFNTTPAPAALENNPTNVIDVTPIVIKEKVQ